MKKPVDEEAHFRIDEHERKFAELGSIAESIPALVQGGVAALHAGFEAKLDKLIATQAEDVESDKEVAKETRELVGEIKELCDDLKSLVRVLSAPTTRTATIHLPSGSVTMVAREEAH